MDWIGSENGDYEFEWLDVLFDIVDILVDVVKVVKDIDYDINQD